MSEPVYRKKWCPMVRVVVVDDEPFTSRPAAVAPTGPDGFCIGPDCMAWRTKLVGAPGNSQRFHAGEDPQFVEEGYCGLGGAP